MAARKPIPVSEMKRLLSSGVLEEKTVKLAARLGDRSARSILPESPLNPWDSDVTRKDILTAAGRDVSTAFAIACAEMVLGLVKVGLVVEPKPHGNSYAKSLYDIVSDALLVAKNGSLQNQDYLSAAIYAECAGNDLNTQWTRFYIGDAVSAKKKQAAAMAAYTVGFAARSVYDSHKEFKKSSAVSLRGLAYFAEEADRVSLTLANVESAWHASDAASFCFSAMERSKGKGGKDRTIRWQQNWLVDRLLSACKTETEERHQCAL